MAQVYPSPTPAGYSETATQSAATNKPVHSGFRSPDRWVPVSYNFLDMYACVNDIWDGNMNYVLVIFSINLTISDGDAITASAR